MTATATHLQGENDDKGEKTTAETVVAVRPNFTGERNKEREKKRNFKEFAVPSAGAEVGKNSAAPKGTFFNNEALLTEPRGALI